MGGVIKKERGREVCGKGKEMLFLEKRKWLGRSEGYVKWREVEGNEGGEWVKEGKI